MENNRKSTVATVLLLIAVLVIGALAGYIYMQKIETDKKIADLENEKIETQEKVDELQEKIDGVSNIINGNLNKEENILRPSKTISKLFNSLNDVEEYCIDINEEIEKFYESEVYIGDAVWTGFKAIYEASSIHEKDIASYDAQNLDNFYTENCWCEGILGNGIGEKIKIKAFLSSEHVNTYAQKENETVEDVKDYLLTQYNKEHEEDNKHGGNFPEITKDNISDFYSEVEQIAIINGYAKTDELWKNNGRVKKLKLIIDNKEEYILELEDTKDLQLFDINYKNDSIIKEVNMEFEILEVYSGEKYEDVCLTSLYLVGGTNLLWGGR